MSAVRYTHANPAAAGLCAASAYKWSSARQYLGKVDGIADTDMVLTMLGGVQGFIEFSRQGNATAIPFPGSRLVRHLSDEDYLRIASGILGEAIHMLKAVGVQERAVAIRTLSERGFPVSVITRITGLGCSEVERYLR